MALWGRSTLNDIILIDMDDEPLSKERLMKIGAGPAYQKHRRFEELLQRKAEETQVDVCHDISNFGGCDNFEDGYQALVRWFRSAVSADT